MLGGTFAWRKALFLLLNPWFFIVSAFLVLTAWPHTCEAGAPSVPKERNPSIEETARGYYPDGNLKYEIQARNGIKQGLAKSYYPTGELHTTVHFTDGQMGGPYKKYYKSGMVYKEYFYVQGKKSGPARVYDPEGRLISSVEYKDDRVIQEIKPDLQSETEMLVSAVAIQKDEYPQVQDKPQRLEGRMPPRMDDDLTSPSRHEIVDRELNHWERFLSHIEWTLGFDRSFMVYKTDDKRDESQFSGVDFSAKYIAKDGDLGPIVDFVKFDFRFMAGESDQKGTRFINTVVDENLDDVPVSFLETSLSMGRNFTLEDWPLLRDSNVDLSMGLGYRYLTENPSDQSLYGYRHDSVYALLPINAQWNVPILGWTLSPALEFDAVLGAWDTSHFSEVGVITTSMTIDGTTYERTGTVDDLTNEISGYGIKGSLKMEKTSAWLDFSAEPYFVYWKFKGSKEEAVTIDGQRFTQTVGDVEYFAAHSIPEYSMSEYGLKFQLKY